jgi:hypothetical protein
VVSALLLTVALTFTSRATIDPPPETVVLDPPVPTQPAVTTATTLLPTTTAATVTPTLAPAQQITPTAAVTPTTRVTTSPVATVPVTTLPATTLPVTTVPVTVATTAAPTTAAPTTAAPTTAASTTAAPTTAAPTTQPTTTAPGIVTRPPTTAATDTNDASSSRLGSWLALVAAVAVLAGGAIVAFAIARRRRRRDPIAAAESVALSEWLRASATFTRSAVTPVDAVRVATATDATAAVLATNNGTGVPIFLRAVAALVGNEGIPAHEVRGLIDAVRSRDERAADAMQSLVAALFDLAERPKLTSTSIGWLRATATLVDGGDVARSQVAGSLDALSELLVAPSAPRVDALAEALRPGGDEKWWRRQVDAVDVAVAMATRTGSGRPTSALASAVADLLDESAGMLTRRRSLGRLIGDREQDDTVVEEIDLRELGVGPRTGSGD